MLKYAEIGKYRPSPKMLNLDRAQRSKRLQFDFQSAVTQARGGLM